MRPKKREVDELPFTDVVKKRKERSEYDYEKEIPCTVYCTVYMNCCKIWDYQTRLRCDSVFCSIIQVLVKSNYTMIFLYFFLLKERKHLFDN